MNVELYQPMVTVYSVYDVLNDILSRFVSNDSGTVLFFQNICLFISANVYASLQSNRLCSWVGVAKRLGEILVSLTQLCLLNKWASSPEIWSGNTASAHSSDFEMLEKQTYHLSGWNHWELHFKVGFPSRSLGCEWHTVCGKFYEITKKPRSETFKKCLTTDQPNRTFAC